MSELGALPTDTSAATWDQVDLTTIVAGCYPDAPADRFLMIDKWMWVALLFDDQFDDMPVGRSLPGTGRVMDQLIRAVDSPAPLAPDAPVLVRAYAAILADFATVVSPTWLRRHRHHLALWWAGVVQTVAQHTTGTAPLSYERRLAIRRMTIGGDCSVDLVEIACEWEMPPCLVSTWTVHRIRDLVCTITACHNDVYSLDKDRATNTDDNIVLAREAIDSPTEAVDLALAQLQADINEISQLLTELHPLARDLDLPAKDRDGVRRWADATALLISGSAHSQAHSARYSGANPRLGHDHNLDHDTALR